MRSTTLMSLEVFWYSVGMKLRTSMCDTYKLVGMKWRTSMCVTYKVVEMKWRTSMCVTYKLVGMKWRTSMCVTYKLVGMKWRTSMCVTYKRDNSHFIMYLCPSACIKGSLGVRDSQKLPWDFQKSMRGSLGLPTFKDIQSFITKI